MKLFQLVNQLLQRERKSSVTFRAFVRGASISVTITNSPFDEMRTHRFVADIGSYLVQGIRTGKLPWIAAGSNAADHRSASNYVGANPVHVGEIESIGSTSFNSDLLWGFVLDSELSQGVSSYSRRLVSTLSALLQFLFYGGTFIWKPFSHWAHWPL
jgi:hypothetical protein